MKFRFTYILAGLFLLFVLADKSSEADPVCSVDKNNYEISYPICLMELSLEKYDEKRMPRSGDIVQAEKLIFEERTGAVKNTTTYQFYLKVERAAANIPEERLVLTLSQTAGANKVWKSKPIRNPDAVSRRNSRNRQTSP